MGKNSDTTVQQINFSLFMLSFAFLIFTFIITVRPVLLDNIVISLQVVLSIPFLTASVLGRLKLLKSGENTWDRFAYVYWILGYVSLINAVGLLLGYLVSMVSAAIFFTGNIIVALSYSWFGIAETNASFASRLRKDAFFIALLLLFGILPLLGAY